MTPSVTFWGAGTFAQALVSCMAPHVTKIIMWGRSEHSFRSSSSAVLNTCCVQHASQSDIWVFCVPAQALRSCLARITSIETSTPPRICILTCKGIERSSGMLMTEIFQEFFPSIPVAVIAGPNFASELLHGALSGLTIAVQTVENFSLTAALFRQDQLDIQHMAAPDALTAWGALKNVAALGCGILWGLTKSHNTLCTFMTQAFVQSKMWIENHIDPGAHAAALSYGALGDFVMSCTSQASRNFQYGVSLATQDAKTPQALVEGIDALHGILARNVRSHAVLPFVMHLERVIYQRIARAHWVSQLCKSDA